MDNVKHDRVNFPCICWFAPGSLATLQFPSLVLRFPDLWRTLGHSVLDFLFVCLFLFCRHSLGDLIQSHGISYYRFWLFPQLFLQPESSFPNSTLICPTSCSFLHLGVWQFLRLSMPERCLVSPVSFFPQASLSGWMAESKTGTLILTLLSTPPPILANPVASALEICPSASSSPFPLPPPSLTRLCYCSSLLLGFSASALLFSTMIL